MSIHSEQPANFQHNPQKIQVKTSESLSVESIVFKNVSLKQTVLKCELQQLQISEKVTIKSTCFSQNEIKSQHAQEKSFQLVRSNDDIRSRYLDKLFSYQKSFLIENDKKHQNIFIFDWDDTVMCSSFINRTPYLEVSSSVRQVLRAIDKICEKIFQIVIKKGYLYIITNAAKGWVQYSSKNYLPKVHSILLKAKHKNVQIRSARALYQSKYPTDSRMWKLQAFKSVSKQLNRNLLLNLIVVGDSQQEMQAGLTISQQFQYVLLKRVRFQTNPSPEELVKQQNLLLSKFQKIVLSTKNITIELMKKDQAKRKLSDNLKANNIQQF